MYRYEAKMDNLAKIMTVVLFCALIIPVSTMIVHISNGHWEVAIILLVVIISLVLAQLYRPLYYTLDAEGIHIHRPASNVDIPFHQISEIRPVTKTDLGRGYRTFGVGGFFGYYGRFYYKEIGRATLYATDANKMVLLIRDGKNIIISPDDQADFLAKAKQLMK